MASSLVIDLSELSNEGDEKRTALNYMARLAEASERYEDMAAIMKQLVMHTDSQQSDLNDEERNLLSVAFKNVIGTRRSSHRTVLEPTEEHAAAFSGLVNNFKLQIEAELENICSEVLGLLENHLVAHAAANNATDEAQVFYIKMLGDYYRYRAESAPASKGYDRKSAHYYERAFKLAQTVLKPTHPTRLGLALNFSVCYYEILQEKKMACDLAKEAFDLAISKLDELKDEEYKDSTLIMQLLRDNLTLWMSSDNGEEDGDDLQMEDLTQS